MREKKEKKSGLKRARRASERSDEDGEDGGRPDAAVDGAGARPRQPVGTAVAVHSAAARDRAEAADEPAAAEVDAAAEESDSDDDGVRNTIGDVPIEWYDDYDHIGYTLDGKRFARPPQRDELDALIERYDKGSARTVYDALHGEYVTLTDDDVNLIRRIQAGQYPDPHFDPFPAPVELAPVQTEPMWSRPAPKSRFLPSKWERKRVVRLVRAMRSEAYQKSIAAQRAQKEAQRPDYNYAIWDETLEDLTREQRRMHKRLLAPKLPPPTNAESYNPPAEYLFTPEEEEEWRNTDPSDRTLGFVPRKFDSLRRVPAYEQLASERFQRCLDLYLCPRTQRTRLQIEPDSLLPQLPDLSQLEPYPKRLTTTYRGHEGRVRTLSVHPAGEWLASGGDDGTVRLWEVATGRCVGEWALARAADAADVDAGAADAPDAIHRVAFAPDSARYLLAVSVGSRVLLLSAAGLAPARAGMDAAADDAAVGEAPAAAGPSVLAWRHESVPTPRLRVGRAGANGQGAAGGGTTHALCIPHAKPARVLAWHPRCDYLATVVPEGGAKAVLLSQVSRRVTQQPFGKSKGRVESGARAAPEPRPGEHCRAGSG